MAFANESDLSATTSGVVGLNTVPSARMEEPGTTRFGLSTNDPYNHAFLGMQIAKPLYVNLRQSMEVSSQTEQPKFVYPGLDFKLRLKEEGRYMPAMAFGMNSALGHERFSSEYFALSKRYYNFDFTGGVAWGRLGSGGILPNPLARISSHFKHDRDFNSQDASSPSDWFTGENIGLFGGAEYYTPIDGLSLKADYNGDDYNGENQSFDFKKPSPWSFGFNYSPQEWVSFGAALIGVDKIMARLTFQTNLFHFKGKSYKDKEPFKFGYSRPSKTDKDETDDMAEAANINLGQIREDKHDYSGVVHLNDYMPSTMQIGRAARYLAANAGPGIETITVIPVIKGTRSKAVTFSRRDLVQAVNNQGSPEEIWKDTTFSDDERSTAKQRKTWNLTFAPELQLSLGEAEPMYAFRTGLVVEERKEFRHGITIGTSARINIADNLARSFKFHNMNVVPIRSDAALYTKNRINIDRSFISFMRTPLPNFHMAVTAGYLEEMYAGAGGEVLYRPFDSPFAIGAEAWKVYKRDPEAQLALGITDVSAATGSLNLYYDIPDTDITTFAKVGKFIGGDIGVNTGAQMQFDNGMKVKGFITVSNADDKDVFGGTRNVYTGLQLAIPLGSIKYVPEGSEARIKIQPLDRDDAAMLDKPYDLYEVTEPTSYRHLGRNWQEVLN